ncbi:MAG: hypothetical protein U5R46_16480 [Gammaproteobacteria bacterium]|nr:hypothetical protein [Gammaproteobacteria bacterium]
MADNAYYVPRVVYRFLPLIYISAGVLALFYVNNLVGTVSSLLLVSAGVLICMWRVRAAAKRRRRERSTPKAQSRADSLRPEHDYPDARKTVLDATSIAGRPPETSRETTSTNAKAAQRSTPPSYKTGRAALFENPRLNRRRDNPDRRGWQPMPDAPFRDSAGAFVKRDRRRLPERRKNSIEVREVSKKEGDPL